MRKSCKKCGRRGSTWQSLRRGPSLLAPGKKRDLYRRVGLGKGCTHRVGLLVSGKYIKHSKLLFSSGAVLASQFIRWEEISTRILLHSGSSFFLPS